MCSSDLSTLASIYSVRPTPLATVSTPVTWRELPRVEIADFTLRNVPARLAALGDLWAPLVVPDDDPSRFDMGALIGDAAPAADRPAPAPRSSAKRSAPRRR